MKTVRRIGNVVLVVLLGLVGYSGYRAVVDAKAHPVPFDDHRPLTLGPAGLDKLRLGMSEQEADATGETLRADPKTRGTAPCAGQEVNGVTIHISRDHGIVGLSGPLDRTRTAEGVGAGATVADITKVYRTLEHPQLGSAKQQVNLFGEFSAPVPGNPKAVYRFIFATFELRAGGSGDGPTGLGADRTHVKHILLSLRDQDDCLTIA